MSPDLCATPEHFSSGSFEDSAGSADEATSDDRCGSAEDLAVAPDDRCGSAEDPAAAPDDASGSVADPFATGRNNMSPLPTSAPKGQ